jgi:hypothetical protein
MVAMKAMSLSAMKTKAMKQAKKATPVTTPVKAKAMKAKAMKAKPMKAPARATATKTLPVKSLVQLPNLTLPTHLEKDAGMVVNSSMSKSGTSRADLQDLQIDIEELEKVVEVMPDICRTWLQASCPPAGNLLATLAANGRLSVHSIDRQPIAEATMAALKHLIHFRAVNPDLGMTCLIWTSLQVIPDDLEGGVISAMHWLEDEAERKLKRLRRKQLRMCWSVTPDTKIAKLKDTGKMKH